LAFPDVTQALGLSVAAVLHVRLIDDGSGCL